MVHSTPICCVIWILRTSLTMVLNCGWFSIWESQFVLTAMCCGIWRQEMSACGLALSSRYSVITGERKKILHLLSQLSQVPALSTPFTCLKHDYTSPDMLCQYPWMMCLVNVQGISTRETAWSLRSKETRITWILQQVEVSFVYLVNKPR